MTRGICSVNLEITQYFVKKNKIQSDAFVKTRDFSGEQRKSLV